MFTSSVDRVVQKSKQEFEWKNDQEGGRSEIQKAVPHGEENWKSQQGGFCN